MADSRTRSVYGSITTAGVANRGQAYRRSMTITDRALALVEWCEAHGLDAGDVDSLHVKAFLAGYEAGNDDGWDEGSAYVAEAKTGSGRSPFDLLNDICIDSLEITLDTLVANRQLATKSETSALFIQLYDAIVVR